MRKPAYSRSKTVTNLGVQPKHFVFLVPKEDEQKLNRSSSLVSDKNSLAKSDVSKKNESAKSQPKSNKKEKKGLIAATSKSQELESDNPLPVAASREAKEEKLKSLSGLILQQLNDQIEDVTTNIFKFGQHKKIQIHNSASRSRVEVSGQQAEEEGPHQVCSHQLDTANLINFNNLSVISEEESDENSFMTSDLNSSSLNQLSSSRHSRGSKGDGLSERRFSSSKLPTLKIDDSLPK